MSDPSTIPIAYVMSSCQLKELWQYDMWLAHVLMDVPMRNCTAMPSISSGMPAMNGGEFLRLKEEVRLMWIFASYNFTCKQTRYGLGLFFSDDSSKQPFIGDKAVAWAGWPMHHHQRLVQRDIYI